MWRRRRSSSWPGGHGRRRGRPGAGGRPTFAEGVDVEIPFGLSSFATAAQDAAGLPVATNDYLIRGAGIDPHGSSTAVLRADAGDDVLEALDAAVKRHDQRLGVIWQSGRFLITLDPDLTPPPAKPGETYGNGNGCSAS